MARTDLSAFDGVEDALPAYEESFQFENCAEITGIEFHAGEPALDGCWINLLARFSTHGAPDGKKWEIWPQEAIVRLGRQRDSLQTFVGAFRAPQGHAIRPAFHTHKSDSTQVSFRRLLSPIEMAAIEEWRDGADLKVQVNITGFGRRGGQVTWSYFRQHDEIIPRSKWIDTLGTAKFIDKVHLAVAVTADKRIKEGAKYLRDAINHHARGDYSNVAQTCRKAVEEIGLAGFGAKPPAEVKKFLKHQDPTTYSLEERAAIVQTAALLYLHSGVHAGEEERRWRRTDAELALALAAALLQVAPARLATTDAIVTTE